VGRWEWGGGYGCKVKIEGEWVGAEERRGEGRRETFFFLPLLIFLRGSYCGREHHGGYKGGRKGEKKKGEKKKPNPLPLFTSSPHGGRDVVGGRKGGKKLLSLHTIIV